jgi:hypothetical protein
MIIVRFVNVDVKLNNQHIQKFLKLDKELDSMEDVNIQPKLAKLENIRKSIKTTAPVGRLFLILDLRAIFKDLQRGEDNKCLLY